MQVEQKLRAQIDARIERLPDEFPQDVHHALRGAEVMFRVQGAVPPVIVIVRNEPGLVPLTPELIAKMQAMGVGPVQYMGGVLACEADAEAVYLTYMERDALCICYRKHKVLYTLRAPITGGRSLGAWTIKTHYPKRSHVETRPTDQDDELDRGIALGINQWREHRRVQGSL